MVTTRCMPNETPRHWACFTGRVFARSAALAEVCALLSAILIYLFIYIFIFLLTYYFYLVLIVNPSIHSFIHLSFISFIIYNKSITSPLGLAIPSWIFGIKTGVKQNTFFLVIKN